MIRTIGKVPERLTFLGAPEKVILTVQTAAVTVYVGGSLNDLRTKVLGNPQGIPLSSTDGKIVLDLNGDVYWVASADGVLVDYYETGAS